MSEQEKFREAAKSESGDTIGVTHRAKLKIGDDGRFVVVHRLIDGGFHFEWVKPDPTNGAAVVSTQFALSKEALEATLECIFGIENAIQAQMDNAAMIDAQPAPAQAAEQ